MRVRATEATRTYWNYQVHEIADGQEVFGELAAHLARTAAPVEVLEGELPDLPTNTDPADATGTPEGTPEDENGPATGDDSGDAGDDGDTGDGPPVHGTIEVLMTWVGDDAERARAALDAEQAKDKPRSTAVKLLTAIADKE